MPTVLKSSLVKTKSGKDAAVQTIQNDDGSLTVAATVAGETCEHRVTIGAGDQPLPASYDQAAFDADVSKARGFVAEMAESAARKKALIAGVN